MGGKERHMTYEEECIKKADEYATEACKCLTRLIGADNRGENPDIIKMTMIAMIRSDIMNAQFGMLHYIKLFMNKEKKT